MADTKESRLRNMLKRGCIGEFFTLNGWFLSVVPAFEIDKVIFRFVLKGSKGSKAFNVYINTRDFRHLCEGIDSGALYKRIQADDGDYPNAWKYATGDKTHLSVAIGKSKKGGVVVQGRDANVKERNAFVPVAYGDLQDLAFRYEVISGLTDVSGYYAELRDLCLAGLHENAKSHAANADTDAPDDEPVSDVTLSDEQDGSEYVPAQEQAPYEDELPIDG